MLLGAKTSLTCQEWIYINGAHLKALIASLVQENYLFLNHFWFLSYSWSWSVRRLSSCLSNAATTSPCRSWRLTTPRRSARCVRSSLSTRCTSSRTWGAGFTARRSHRSAREETWPSSYPVLFCYIYFCNLLTRDKTIIFTHHALDFEIWKMVWLVDNNPSCLLKDSYDYWTNLQYSVLTLIC